MKNRLLFLVVFVNLLPGFARSEDLPELEWVSSIWSTGSIRLKFVDDPVEMRYDRGLTPRMRDLGFTDVPMKEGGSFPLPNYVLNIYEAARSTRRKWAGSGFSAIGREPGIFYVDEHYTVDESEADGLYDSTKSEVINHFWTPRIYVMPNLSPTDAVATTIHEWTHAAQVATLGSEKDYSGYWKGFIEGTAVWAEDLPIEIVCRGVRLTKSLDWGTTFSRIQPGSGQIPRVNADDLNTPYHYFSPYVSGYNDNIILSRDGYGSCFFWKYFAQRAVTSGNRSQSSVPENNANAIMKYGIEANSRDILDHAAFIDTIASQLPPALSTDPIRRFGRFYEDFLASATALGAAGGTNDRFQDEAIRESTIYKSSFNRLVFGKALSNSPSKIPSEDASNENEITRRLASIAKSLGEIAPLGWKNALIGLGLQPMAIDAVPYQPPGNSRRRIFLLVLGGKREDGPSRLALAALCAEGPRSYINSDVKMDRLDLSLQGDDFQFVEDRYAAYVNLGTFHKKGEMERLHLSIGNCDPGGESREAAIGYVVSPVFEPVRFTGQKRGSGEKAALLSSEPNRRPGRDSFRAGDLLEFVVAVSDPIHLGNDQNIAEENTTLRVSLISPSGEQLEVEDKMLSLYTGNTSTWSQFVYRVNFRLPDPLDEEGDYSARFEISSLLRLGEEDRDVVEATFLAGGKSPAVTSVTVTSGRGRVLYDTAAKVYRPIPPGKHNLAVDFDRKIAMDRPVAILLDGKRVPGSLESNQRRWSGSFEVPHVPNEFLDWEGEKRLSIAAFSEEGIPLDNDAEAAGDQPDDSNLLLIDVPPPWVTHLSATVGDEVVYDAEWTPDTDDERSDWRVSSEDDAGRKLIHEIRKRIPEEAENGRLEFTINSGPGGAKPTVTLGDIPLEPEVGNRPGLWICEFDLALLREEIEPGKPIQIKIEAENKYRDSLDADPSSAIQYADFGERVGYNRFFAGPADSQFGGPDLWHQLNLEEDPQWIEEKENGETKSFTLLQRADQMIARFEKIEFRGSKTGEDSWKLRAESTLDYSLSSGWYDIETRRRIPTPVKPISQAFASGSRDLYYLKRIKLTTGTDEPWRFAGFDDVYGLQWSNDFELLRVIPPFQWREIRWKPAIPEIPDPGEETEQEPGDALPDDKPVTTLTSYRLRDRGSTNLKIVTVERIAYRRQGDAGARLVVTSYPVSYIEDTRGDTGLSYNVQWQSGRPSLTRLALNREEISPLRAEYDRLADGGFSLSELDERLQSLFGKGSRPLYASSHGSTWDPSRQ